MRKALVLPILISLVVSTWSCKIIDKFDNHNVATIESFSVSILGDLRVAIKPKDNAIANEVYTVYLYEKGQPRDHRDITFTQPEINVHSAISVYFPLSKEEKDAYIFQDLSEIFSANVRK